MDERQERFRELYTSTSPRVVSYALRRTASPEDAADVTAEAFTIAWRRLDDLRDTSEGLPWMYAICRRVVANHARRTRRRSELTERIGEELRRTRRESLDPSPAPVAVTVLQQLDEPDREILMLVAWEGLDTAQLARALECSPTAARIRLHRARRRLTTLMEDSGLQSKQSPVVAHTGETERAAVEKTSGA